MWTRQQYMNKECTHQEYYLPIAQECGISLIKSPIAFKILHSTDPHFNDISLKEWDAYAFPNQSCFQRVCKKRGDQYSLASGVSILKAIAQHEKELGLYEHWRNKSNPYKQRIDEGKIMTTEEKLWRRFKDMQNKINSLSSIVQNSLEEHQISQEEINEWREAGYKVYSDLGLLILETHSFLESNNAKDI